MRRATREPMMALQMMCVIPRSIFFFTYCDDTQFEKIRGPPSNSSLKCFRWLKIGWVEGVRVAIFTGPFSGPSRWFRGLTNEQRDLSLYCIFILSFQATYQACIRALFYNNIDWRKLVASMLVEKQSHRVNSHLLNFRLCGCWIYLLSSNVWLNSEGTLKSWNKILRFVLKTQHLNCVRHRICIMSRDIMAIVSSSWLVRARSSTERRRIQQH